MLTIKASGKIERQILDYITRESIVCVAILDVDASGESTTHQPSERTHAVRLAGRKAEGGLTLRDHIINVIVSAEKPLTTREVTKEVQKTRRGAQQNTIYNALRLARMNGLIKQLPNRTWARISPRD